VRYDLHSLKEEKRFEISQQFTFVCSRSIDPSWALLSAAITNFICSQEHIPGGISRTRKQYYLVKPTLLCNALYGYFYRLTVSLRHAALTPPQCHAHFASSLIFLSYFLHAEKHSKPAHFRALFENIKVRHFLLLVLHSYLPSRVILAYPT